MLKRIACKHESKMLFHVLYTRFMKTTEGEYCTICMKVLWTKDYEINDRTQYYCPVCGSRDIEQALDVGEQRGKEHCRCHACKASWTIDKWHGTFC
jgi:hypothetical protein